jgi:hypothetical protein
MKKQFGTYNVVLVIVLVVALGLLAFNGAITGNVVEGTSGSEVIVEKYLSIAFSTELANGINFGTVNVLPSSGVEADQNAAGVGSNYHIDVSSDGNTAVDFCVQADKALTSVNADTIPMANEKMGFSKVADAPTYATSTSLATTWAKTELSVVTNSSAYYRFWLDVDAATPAGSYNNTLTFKGVVAGDTC